MMNMVPSLTVEDSMKILYPLVYPVTDLALENVTDEVSQIVILYFPSLSFIFLSLSLAVFRFQLVFPGCVRAAYEYFNNEKAYLMCNGIMMFLWIGLGVSQEWVQDVFNANSVAQLNTESVSPSYISFRRTLLTKRY